ncbi:MAG TPA: (d)CMP kinase [Candidatus Ruminococcus avistercoris]|nr:(d)CMP kinase [Candidatus Ruminococcus avistercoris]
MSFNIAIDGPAGAGKSTIARSLARSLGFIYVDTGAMYRAMAYYFLKNRIDPENKSGIEDACADVDITITYENGEQQVLLNGENITSQLRKESVGNMASVTSALPAVRIKLTQLQKKLAASTDVVMDGRDIGTAVLPDAQMKIYLTAGTAVRAKRRYEELKAQGIDKSLESIEKDIRNRDYRDMHRDISPLCQAEDAVLVDTSDMDIETVLNTIRRIYEEKKRS